VKIPKSLRHVFPYRIDHVFDHKWRYQRFAVLAISDTEENLLALTAGDYADRLHCLAYNVDELRRESSLSMEQFRQLFVRAVPFPTSAEARKEKLRLKKEAEENENSVNPDNE